MDDLIEALQIFKKYVEPDSYQANYPTHCEHDIMIMSVNTPVAGMDTGDAQRLDQLGFHWSTEFDCWASFKFGSC